MSTTATLQTAMVALAVDWALDCKTNKSLVPEAIINLASRTALVAITFAAALPLCDKIGVKPLSSVTGLAAFLACLAIITTAFKEMELDSCVMEKTSSWYNSIN